MRVDGLKVARRARMRKSRLSISLLRYLSKLALKPSGLVYESKALSAAFSYNNLV